MKANYYNPYALIKYGKDIGFKLAWIEKYVYESNTFIGYAANKHFSKICKTGILSIYKSKREIEPVKTWRNLPSLKAIQQVIKRTK